MRTGLSTINQTLTPEASTVLNSSISEASRRRHSQTTPLHVAAALLSSPTGPLRQACIKSHPNSSHPLQCRALELCFSVALDRLPSTPSPSPPPLSNALMAALKRAQAHQRRGCPEQQQQPLLAIKVELKQLIVSILDDPSVSRVMREASFSSPAVKSALEQTITSSSSSSPTTSSSATRALGILRPVPNSPLHPNRSFCLNPRFQTHTPNSQLQPIGEEEVRKIMEVFSRRKKRNPILVGDSEPQALLKEVLGRIERKEGLDGTLQKTRIISVGVEFDKNRPEIMKRIEELGETIGAQLEDGVLIDLGDLRWLVEAPTGVVEKQKLVSEVGKAAVVEMGLLIRRLEEERRKKVWVIGSASCATYLRCQVYHPTMEIDWDLQAVPIAARSPVLSSFTSSTNATGILSSSVESLTQSRVFSPITATAAPKRALPDLNTMCLVCTAGYEKELAELHEDQNPLPQWLRAAKSKASDTKQSAEEETRWKKNEEELLGRWKDICLRLHRNTEMHDASPPRSPRSPVRTELALGPSEDHTCNKTRRVVKKAYNGDASAGTDPNDGLFKKAYKRLLEQVTWQPEAAASAASVVARRRRRNVTWLLFAGPDKMGKRRMAAALSEVAFGASGGNRVAVVSLAGNEDGDPDTRYWGKVAVNRIAEAVTRNSFAVFVLEDIDRADVLVQSTIRRAAEKGRLPDARGREVSLGGAIFILTSGIAPEDATEDSMVYDENMLEATSRNMWRLELSRETAKRRLELGDAEEERKRRKQRNGPSGIGWEISLDLNLGVGAQLDGPAGDGSGNSSDVTVEIGCRRGSLPSELVDVVDEMVVFKGVDFGPLRRKVVDVIRRKFELVVGGEHTIEVDGEALDVMVGGAWFGEMATGAAEVDGGFEDWVEKVVVPSFWKLRNREFREGDCGSVVKLVAVKVSYKCGEIGGLPSGISIVK